MSFEWFIARRYLTARRRQAFVSLISIVSILGVGVGVMALIIALALMTGVQGELRDRIVGSTAHIYVYKTGAPFGPLDQEIERLQVPGVTGAAPAIIGYGMLRSTASTTAFVTIKGIDPVRERAVTDIGEAMRGGSLDSLVNVDSDYHIVLGEDLAKTLGLAVGDEVQLFTPQAVMTPGMSRPRIRIMTVSGIFRFGFYEYDSAYALMSLAAADSLLESGGPGLIQLRVADLDDAPAARAALQARLDATGQPYLVQDWTELNKPLYQALHLEKIAISLTIGLIVMVAALNIVASLVLLVMEKSRDIAILRTMGASARAIRRIFVLQGLTIGVIGTVGGTVLGLVACYIAEKYELIKLPGDVYQITHLQFRVLPLDVLTVVVSAILVCYLATIYPARQAGRLDPAEALRNQ